MADAGAHRNYFLNTSELIFTKAEYEENNRRDETTITTPSVRESNLYPHLITATALRQILDGYNPSSAGGFSYNSLVKAIGGAPGSHTYTMCTSEDEPYAPGIGLFVDLFDKFNAVVGVLPSQSKPTVTAPTVLTSVFALKDHTHAAFESRGASHDEIWAAISAGDGGSGGSGGVIDGTLCKDAQTGEDCVTTISLNNNNQTSYTYISKHHCLLLIQLRNAVVADNESTEVPRDCILVKVGNNVVGTLTDNMQDLHNDLDNDSLRIPIKAGTTVTLVGDGVKNIFDDESLTENSYIQFSEFELTSLSMATGLPAYDQAIPITDYVARTSLETSKGYTASQNGYVLFRFDTTKFSASKDILVVGKVAGVEVYNGYYYNSQGDAALTPNFVPVRNGDSIDLITSDSTGTAYVANDGYFQVIFFPMAASAEEGEGPIEYPVLECAFTDTTNNPFIGTTIPSTDDLTITPAKLEALCGRSDIDLNTASISLKVDVFRPLMNAGAVVLDDNGHATVDKRYPLYRNEAIVYADADNSPAGYYNDYSRHLDVSVVNGAAKIAWTSAFAKAAASDDVRASFILPALSTLVSGSIAQRAEWDDFNNRYGGYIDNAANLGLSGYYIRLTAVIDPNTKIVRQSKAGMFIDGEINKDDNGNVCKKLVTYDEWAANGNTTDGYTYVYTVKTDCLLYMNVGIEFNNNSTEEVVIKINGETLDTYTDTGLGSGSLVDMCRVLSLPLSRGTKVSFYTKATPIHNQTTYTGTFPGGEEFIIKLIEFKMSTELTPAKFPSLAIRVCDVDCHEESANASVLPAGSTCEYFTWSESQMRQVFGSAFDFDHARFDVSAVFYVGNSASDYDTADNKLQDDGILISPTSQGQQVRPSVTIDTVNGERIAKLALPGIDYFCSTVKSDTTDGFKLVTRADGAHLGIGSSGNNLVSDFNTGYSKKVRMRLLLHVSDRRSEASHMYASTPDWDTSKKTVINTGDRVPADGWIACVINESTENDGTFNLYVNDINVISGKRHGSAYTDSQPAVVPVAKGDKITYTATAGVFSLAVTFYPAKHTQLEVPDFNVPGSAGVIDGSIWKKADGVTDESTTIKGGDTTSLADNSVLNSSTKTLTYLVKNDCYLYISCDNTGNGLEVGVNAWSQQGMRIQVLVNEKEVGRLLDVTHVTGNSAYDMPFLCVPVAGGSVVKLQNQSAGSSDAPLFSTITAAGSVTFTEFKLRVTNVVAAMPDWSATPTTITSGDTITADGWLYCYGHSGGNNGDYNPSGVKVNDHDVMYICCYSHGVGTAHSGIPVPVSKGDKITTFGSIDSMQFYPVKTRESKSETSPDLYTVGADGVLLNRATNVVTMTGNTTLKLPAAVTGKVRGFEVTVQVTTAGSITWNNADDTAFTSYVYTGSSDPIASATFTAGTIYQFKFKEIISGTFRVELEAMTSPQS